MTFAFRKQRVPKNADTSDDSEGFGTYLLPPYLAEQQLPEICFG